MAKVANPVRGYLSCPVCQSVATVHQVGEGKLIELGEPPKNNRNLGLLYYKCPKCGNSAMSKEISSYVEKHIQPESNQVVTEEVTVDLTEAVTVEGDIVTEELTVEELDAQPLLDKVESVEVTVDNSDVKAPFLTPKRVATALGMLLLLFCGWQKMKPRTRVMASEPEANHG